MLALFSLFLFLVGSHEITVTPSHGFEPVRTHVRIKLSQPTQYPICIWFDADGAAWRSCWDGEPDRLFYERRYTLDAGNYMIWVETRDGRSEKRSIQVLAKEPL